MHAVRRSCVLFLWMHTLTLVKSKDCLLQNFLNSNLNDGHFDTSNLQSSYSDGRQVRVPCNIGYSGFFKLVCEDGIWSSKGHSCKVKTCGHPGDAQFADFHLDRGDDFVFGSQVVYTCQKGYQMVSRINFRRCLADGWDGVIPVCEAIRCPVVPVESNVRVIGNPEESSFGNVLRFSCKSNSEVLFGQQDIICGENGEWTGTVPKCKEVKCTTPFIENGFVPGDVREYNEHEELFFQCDPKFKRSIERLPRCTKIGIRALWSPTPVCEPIKCIVEQPVEGTNFSPDHKNVFLPEETLKVICDANYWIVNHTNTEVETTCNNLGKWTITPICREFLCINWKPDFVNNWGVRRYHKLNVGYKTSYECQTGYRNVKSEVTCTRAGWAPNPLCQEITCDRMEIPNADFANYKQTYKYNERINYICKEGYKGNPYRICYGSGWYGYSSCAEITCSVPQFPFAEVTDKHKQVYKYAELVKFSCKNNAEHFTLTCGAQGWIGTAKCPDKPCEKPEIPNAIFETTQERYDHNQQVKYSCMHNDNTRFTILCEQGVWTGIKDCTDCPKVEVPNGAVVGPHNGMLYYTCKNGFKRFSRGWWGEATCENHVWNGIEQCIEVNKCGEIPVIPNGKVSPKKNVHENDDIVPIVCEQGFDAKISTLTCREGVWRSAEPFENICTPSPTNCAAPPQFDDAVVLTPYKKLYLTDSEVTYQCRAGYTIGEENTLRCQNGQWEAKKIVCTQPTLN